MSNTIEIVTRAFEELFKQSIKCDCLCVAQQMNIAKTIGVNVASIFQKPQIMNVIQTELAETIFGKKGIALGLLLI